MLNTFIRWLVLICLLFGSTFLVQAQIINAKAWLGQWLIERSWEQTIATGDRNKPWPWADSYPVAELSVRRLGVSQVLLAGESGSALAFAPALRAIHSEAEGAQMSGSLFLAQAHRDTHFRFLRDLRRDDLLVLKMRERTLYFRVQQLQELNRPEISISTDLINEGESYLMLSTCLVDSSWSAETRSDYRYVVLAKQLKEQISERSDQTDHGDI